MEEPEASHGLGPADRRVVAAVMAAVTAIGVTTTAMGVVARPLAYEIGADAVQLGWGVNAYLLVAASLALVGARLGDRFGRRRIFGVGCACFAVGSLVAAAAPGFEVLLVGRVLQGVGAALVLPSSIEVIAVSLTGEAERRALLVRGTAFAVAFGVGPLVGGLFADTLGWRWVFVVVAVLAAVSALLILPRSSPVVGGEPLRDPVGAVASVAGVFAVVLVAERGRAWGGAAAGIGSALLAFVVVAAFVAYERRRSAPLVHPSLLRDRMVAGGDLATFASALGMLGLLYFFGLYASSAATLEWSALGIAVALVPFAASLALLGLLAGWLSHRLGPAVPVVVGMGLMAVGFLVLGQSSVDSTDAEVAIPLAICGIGAGIANACVTRPAVLSVDHHRLGEAAGVASLARFAGTALALAIGTSTYLGVGAHEVSTSPEGTTASEVAGVGADELVIGGDAFQQALGSLEEDLRASFREAVELDTLEGFTRTMRWTGIVIGVAALGSGWLLRRRPQDRQSVTGATSRGPRNGSETGAPDAAEA
jgi:DHA2 family methylenomycin A resistance protein-like MFS transporter